MKVALAQINAYLGNFSENRKKILEFAHKACDRSCDFVVFPEAALFGYHPVDLLERPSVVKEQLRELKTLHRQMPKGIAILIGAITASPLKNGKLYNNSAVLLERGKKPRIFAKELLPTYDVFDEGRHIEPGDVTKNIFSWRGKRILVTICEDIWAWPNGHHGKRSPYVENPLKKIKAKDIDFVFNLSASPFTPDKPRGRLTVCRETAKYFNSPMVYVNGVGARGEVVFDGRSVGVSPKGKVVAQARHFCEDIIVYDSELGRGFKSSIEKEAVELHRQALVLGIRDFVYKTGFSHVHLGLSGGVDSAVVACLAVDALGPDHVTCIFMPGPHSQEQSLQLATKLATNLGVNSFCIDISQCYELVAKTFRADVKEFTFGTVDENFQARLRGMMLMGFGNLNASLLLNTSNKSELATGYSTLYGDLIGALCPIGDLLKTQVYELAGHYNSQRELIPKTIIERPPSAELRPDQKDTDSLPPYDQLDPVVKALVEKFKTPTKPLEQDILVRMMNSEFKRWQAPPILKVSNHAFGRGRRLPVAHKSIF